MTKNFTSPTKAFRAFLLENLPDSIDGDHKRVGGAYALRDGAAEWYVQLTLLGGPTNQTEGTFYVDVDIFAWSYHEAEFLALELDALALRYPRVVEVGDRKVVFDTIEGGLAAQRPSDDEQVYHLGTTYALTIRRT